MFFNKVAGAVLAVLLIILALPTLSDIVFQKGGHHGGGHEEESHSMNERLAANFAYYLPVEESEGHGAVEEEVFDLGAMLAMASVEDGAASFRSKCSSCHNAETPGLNGAGPALHDVVGRQHASAEGFGGYSATLSGMPGPWTYEGLNEFLANPRGYVPGTAMSFAGLRRDPERMNVIAYLASQSPNAPPFPDPLPAASEEGEAHGDVIEASAEDAVEGAEATLEGAVAEAGDAVEGLVEQVQDAAEAVVEDATDAATDAADEVVTGRHGPTNH